MRVLILLLLLLTGCAAPQAYRPDASSVLITDQYVDDVLHLLEVVTEATSPERKAEAIAMLKDEELGKNFAYEARLKGEKLQTNYDIVLLMETIGLFATYNPYVQQHKTELEQDLCRSITPKVATGEIWLTAGNSNFEPCLKDRQYVEAVVSNSLQAQQNDNNEKQALQALLTRIPFTDIMKMAKENKKIQVGISGERSVAITPADVAAHELAEKSKPKISLRVIPDGYDSFRWKLMEYMRSWHHVRYEDNPDKDTIVIRIKIDGLDSISGTKSYKDKRYTRKECDEKIAKKMKKDDYYMQSYTELSKLWIFRGTFTIQRGSSAATESFSLDFKEKIVNCTYSRIFSHKKGATEIHEFANTELERFCTKNSKEFTRDEMLSIFGGIFGRTLAKHNWK